MPRVKLVLPEEVAKRVFVDAASSAERMARLDAAMERALAAPPRERFAMMQLAAEVKRGPCVEVEVLLGGDVTERFLAYARAKDLRAEVMLAGALLVEPGSRPPESVRPTHPVPTPTQMPVGEDLAAAEALERFANADGRDAESRERALTRCLAIRERSLGEGAGPTIRARHWLGRSHLATSNAAEALVQFERNLELLDAPNAPPFEGFDQMLSALGTLYREQGRNDDAERCWRRLVRRFDEQPERSSEEKASARLTLADILSRARRFDDALRVIAEALRQVEGGGAGVPRTLENGLWLASSVIAAKGDLVGGEAMYQRYVSACGKHGSVPAARAFRR